MNIMGIDVGINGAVCTIEDDGELMIYDLPTNKIEKNGKIRRQLDISGFIKIIRDENPDHIFVEKVGAMPKNGSGAMFAFGYGAGVIEGCIAACGFPYTYVTPMKWKKDMGAPADKDGARMRASQLLPQHKHNWDLKKHDGRAESCLLALYGRKHI